MLYSVHNEQYHNDNTAADKTCVIYLFLNNKNCAVCDYENIVYKILRKIIKFVRMICVCVILYKII